MTRGEARPAAGGNDGHVARLFQDLRAVVFDFDGVLVDSVGLKSEAFAALYPLESESFRAAIVTYHLEHGGTPRADKIAHFEEMRTGQPPSARRLHELVDLFADLVTKRVISAPEMDCAEQLLEHLSRRMPLFICSATPEPELRQIVGARGWQHFFGGVFGSPKAKHTILSQIVVQMGCDSENVLMVGDAQTDMESASRAGTRFLLLNEKAKAFPGEPMEVRSLCEAVEVLTRADLDARFPHET